MSNILLRLVEVTVLRNYSPSDTRQVPAAGASVAVAKEGATVTTTVTCHDQTDTDVAVADAGRLVVGDIVSRNGISSEVFTVDGIAADSKTVTLGNASGQDITFAPGERLIVMAPTPNIYADPVGALPFPGNVATLDSRGYARFYCPEPRIDYLVFGGGLPSQLYFQDIEAGWARDAVSWVNAKDYQSIQAAIDALPPAGGTVSIPGGTYSSASVPALSALKVPANVTIRGDGPDVTILNYDANSLDDIITVQGDSVTVADLSILGKNIAGTGRGIYVKNLDPNFLLHVALENVQVTQTPSWGVYLEGAPPNVTIVSSINRCTIFGALSGGDLFVGTGCTTVRVTDSTFNGPAYGTYGVSAVPMGQVHIKNATSVTFRNTVFQEVEGSDAPCLSLEGVTINVVVRDCYFEWLGSTGSQYFITTSRGCNNLILSGTFFTRNLTTVGPRVLMTDGGDSTCELINSIVEGCSINTRESAPQGDDFAFRSEADAVCLIFNSVVNTATGAIRDVSIGAGAANTAISRVMDGRRLRLPLVSSGDRTSMAGVVAGTLVYDRTLNQLFLHNGNAWQSVNVT